MHIINVVPFHTSRMNWHVVQIQFQPLALNSRAFFFAFFPRVSFSREMLEDEKANVTRKSRSFKSLKFIRKTFFLLFE